MQISQRILIVTAALTVLVLNGAVRATTHMHSAENYVVEGEGLFELHASAQSERMSIESIAAHAASEMSVGETAAATESLLSLAEPASQRLVLSANPSPECALLLSIDDAAVANEPSGDLRTRMLMWVVNASATGALVAHFPVDSATDSATFLNDTIDDPSHGVTDGTTTGSGSTATGIAGSSILFNAFRGGDVLSTIEGHRYLAGTQDIDLNSGFSWTLWVNVDSINNTDANADSIIGTRSGSATGGTGNPWHKIDRLVTNNWHGATPTSGNYTGGTLADDTWHFLAYVGDTASRQLYKDGVLIGTDTNLTAGHNLTFNGKMEIGGTAQFAEDVTGLYDDIAIWNERLTTDEAMALYEISSPPSLGGLLYDAGQFNLLKQVHDANGGSVMIGNLTWTYTTGLVGPAGLDGTTLILNSQAGTGLVGLAPVPEPATAALAIVGLAALTMRRRKRGDA